MQTTPLIRSSIYDDFIESGSHDGHNNKRFVRPSVRDDAKRGTKSYEWPWFWLK